MLTRLRTHGTPLLLGAGCVALSALVVVLAQENRALKAASAAHAAPATAAPSDPRDGPGFAAGERFPALALRDADGAVRTVDLDDAGVKTLLLVLADACPVCPQIVGTWAEASPHFLERGARVLGVLLAPGTDLGTDMGAGPGAAGEVYGGAWIDGVPLGTLANLSELPLIKLRTVPLTVVVDEAGVIEWVHYGTLTDLRLAELLAHMP
jgi:hypothetical protein